jgi:hypothetical protein
VKVFSINLQTGTGHLGLANWVWKTGTRANWVSSQLGLGQLGLASWLSGQKGPTRSQLSTDQFGRFLSNDHFGRFLSNDHFGRFYLMT